MAEAEQLTPEHLALAVRMLTDLPRGEVITTDALRPLLNVVLAELAQATEARDRALLAHATLYAERNRAVSALAKLVAWWDSPTFSGPDTAEGRAAWAEARRVLAELRTTTEEKRDG